MKKNIFYLFAHQDDEFGCFIKLDKDILTKNTYVFYLTSGSNKIFHKNKLSSRDKESLKTLKKLGLKEKNIFFIGRDLEINHYTLYSNLEKAYTKIKKIAKIIGKPDSIVTHSWEGGHEDHDACNLIGRKIAYKFGVIENSYQFSLYNAFKTSIIFFKVFNPIKKNRGIFSFAKLNRRIFYIRLLFIYSSQIRIWFGLYPFIIFHYLFKGYNFMEKLDKDKIIKRPHAKKLLYEVRKFCTYKKFRSKTKSFLID
jgi:hypothetical protein